ncbi:hypothetical protein ACQP1V_26510 [Microtetraspora malaysiensis]|uniref:hypothetical protein n=1 Tax=Microtetraspora malaysiensis TaxID=161358 RepID=UPI003D9116C5
MKRLLTWTASRVNRRQVLRGATATAFGTLAGLAVGQSPVQAAVCTGPYGSGHCGSSRCSGSDCLSSAGCSYYNGCGGGACWSYSPGYYCCDCKCGGSYCYCNGR